MTEFKTFRELVAAMRVAQKNYFKERTNTTLRAALKLELRVDAWLQRHGTEALQLSIEHENETEVHDDARAADA